MGERHSGSNHRPRAADERNSEQTNGVAKAGETWQWRARRRWSPAEAGVRRPAPEAQWPRAWGSAQGLLSSGLDDFPRARPIAEGTRRAGIVRRPTPCRPAAFRNASTFVLPDLDRFSGR